MSERFDTFSAPSPSQAELDLAAGEAATLVDDEEDALDPQDAARLLEERRKAGGGSSSDGPARWALAVLYGTLAVWGLLNFAVLGRATSGVGGRMVRRRAIVGLGVAVIWICVYVVQGALYHAGAGKATSTGSGPRPAP
jgi:hypothetical protein